MFRIGPSVEATGTGSTVYELPPGETLCRYHDEYGEEEWLLVLQGRPTVRPRGHRISSTSGSGSSRRPAGAHRVQNDSDETVRVLIYSKSPIPARPSTPTATRSGVDRKPG